MRTLRGHDVQDTLAVTGGADSARQCRLRQSAALADSARQCRRDRRRCLASRRPRPLPAPTGGPSLTPRPHRGGPGRSPSLTSHPVRGPVGHGRSRSVTAPRPRPQAGGAPPASWHGGGGGGGYGEALAKMNQQHPPTTTPTPNPPTHGWHGGGWRRRGGLGQIDLPGFPAPSGEAGEARAGAGLRITLLHGPMGGALNRRRRPVRRRPRGAGRRHHII